MDAVAKIDSGEVTDYVGYYHYSNEGVCSWYDFSKEIFRQEGIEVKCDPSRRLNIRLPQIGPTTAC
jgi:dTDP-4-dehydrorhamnose reductase